MTMKWFKRLFGGQPKAVPPELPEPRIELPRPATECPAQRSVNIDLKVLKQLFPIRTLNDDTLAAFVLDRKADIYPAGSVLFRAGDPVHSVHYLLQGRVLLETPDGAAYEVEAGTLKARFPLYSGRQYSATAQAETEVQVLRVSAKVMSHMAARGEAMNTILNPDAEEIPAEVRASRPFRAFCENCLSAEPSLPSLPSVAVKLSQAVERDCSLRELAKHIQLDPFITARLISVANSPLYHADGTINTCQDAIATLGTGATRSLVLSLCLRQAFEHKDPRIGHLLHEHWRNSVYLSALCYVLAEGNGGVSKEEALLAGLVSDIGALPFLRFVGDHPGEGWQLAEIQAALPWLRGPVGAYLLTQWRFPQELAQMPLLAENWCYESDMDLSLADIVILSKLHAYIGSPRSLELPAINSVPAFSKLKEGRLSPEHSLDMLAKAKHRIQAAMRFFSEA